MMKGTADTCLPTHIQIKFSHYTKSKLVPQQFTPYNRTTQLNIPTPVKKKKKRETEKSESHINRYTNIWGNIVVFAPDGRVWQLGRPS